MKAKDVMTRAVISVGPETSVQQIARLLLRRRISAGRRVVVREAAAEVSARLQRDHQELENWTTERSIVSPRFTAAPRAGVSARARNTGTCKTAPRPSSGYTMLAVPNHPGHKRSFTELHQNPYGKETDHGNL
jgi:CBS domain-containing protein